MEFGNHGLWLAFLGFMGLRAVTLGWVGWRLQEKGFGFSNAGATPTLIGVRRTLWERPCVAK